MEFTDDRDEFNNDSLDDLPETETSTALVPRYVDILRELLTEGFTAVKFFKKTHFSYSMRTDAEKALRQALTHVSAEDDDLGEPAKSLLAVVDIHLKASRTEKFWASLRIKEEKDRTCRLEELKQKSIHVQLNVIDEHIHVSDESKMEFTKSTMEAPNYNEADTIGYQQHTNTPKKRSFKEVQNVHETSSGDYTEGEEDENYSDGTEEGDEN
ncbi:7127_t:CDS:2 [Ambispora leptoticha]|uniref:7127_t:CDS:1 n=1 Tax=Ambispora leptoticha TaxID=144679 RepID=A0A9N9C3E9_9GLOM|nr:7127_t:CDS:2 [Ambispora leptoticha]